MRRPRSRPLHSRIRLLPSPGQGSPAGAELRFGDGRATAVYSLRVPAPQRVGPMPVTVIVGAQWGDEGKGKIVDLLAEQHGVVARYQGGNNAGHTVIVGDEEFRFSLLPSGILFEGKTCILGGGCVIDPEALMAELDALI